MRFESFKRVLVTGATGFVGSHLVDLLVRKHPEAEIFVTKRWHLSPIKNLIKYVDRLKVIDCDITDVVSTEKFY